MVKICVFGDSIARGSGDLKEGGWVDMLKRDIESQHYKNKVYNLGVSREGTTQLLERFHVECKARSPDIIIFAIGIGDTHSSTREGEAVTSLEKFKENLHALYTEASHFSKHIMFIGLTRVDEEKANNRTIERYYYNKKIEQYDSVISAFCIAKKLPYTGIFEELTPDERYDGIHPNTKGHQKIFQTVKMCLQNIKIQEK